MHAEPKGVPCSPMLLFGLILVLAGAAYARFAGLTSAGFQTGDDFFYYRWAYDWYLGKFQFNGMYRIGIPAFGALAIKLFGPNDYSIHLLICIMGTLNVFLSILVGYLITRSPVLALAVGLLHGWAPGVVEMDRFEIPYTITETFFLASCLLLAFSYRLRASANTGDPGRSVLAMGILFLSGLSLGIASHAHWDIAIHGVTLALFIMYFSWRTKERLFTTVASLAMLSAGFFLPLLMGMLQYGPENVIGAILHPATILDPAKEQIASSGHFFNAAVRTFKRLINYPYNSYFVGLFFVLGLGGFLHEHLRPGSGGAQGNPYTVLALLAVVTYIALVYVLKLNTYIEARHVQHSAPLLLAFTLYYVRYGAERFFNAKPRAVACALAIVLCAIAVQSTPWDIFSKHNQKVSSYRIMGDVLGNRATTRDRVLIVPYEVLDFRYQSNTPPCYLDKSIVDYLYEYTSDLSFSELLAKNDIRYIVLPRDLIWKGIINQVGVGQTWGLAYGRTPTEYSYEFEMAELQRQLDQFAPAVLYRSDSIEIYDLFPGRPQ